LNIKLVICGTAGVYSAALPLNFRTIVLAEALKTAWFYADKFISLSLLIISCQGDDVFNSVLFFLILSLLAFWLFVMSIEV